MSDADQVMALQRRILEASNGLAVLAQTRTEEIARLEADAAEHLTRYESLAAWRMILNELLISAGFRGGDRDQIYRNVERLIHDNRRLRTAALALEFTPTKLTHLRDLAEVCRAQSVRRDGSCSDPSVPAAWSARWRTLDQFVIPAVELLGRVTGATPCDHTPELPIGGGVPFCAKCGHSFGNANLPDNPPDNA